MEQPKAETEPKTESPGKDQHPKPEQPDPKSADHAPNDYGNLGSFVMGSDPQAQPQTQAENQSDTKVVEAEQSPNRSPSGTRKSVHWSPVLVTESPSSNHNIIYSNGSNPYVAHNPATPSSFSFTDTMVTVRGALGRWGSKVGEATRKAEDLAGNTWQHLKTAPSFADAAMGRIAQSTKVLAEGGYEKIFRQTFETGPEEQLQNSFACYLSTSAGPVMGILYVSTAKLAYCSDNPLSYKNDGQTEWSYYKVVIPSHQLKEVNPSSSRVNTAEKYIQVISVDNHEFWFMGFLNYYGAVKSLQEALQAHNLESV